MTTWAFACANRRAMPSPRPRPPPVITTVVPENDSSGMRHLIGKSAGVEVPPRNPPSIDPQVHPRDIARAIGCEEHHRIGDLIDLGNTPHGGALSIPLEARDPFANGAIHHFGPSDA